MPSLINMDIDLMGQLGIWQQQESLDFFRQRLELSEFEKVEISKFKKKKRLSEWYASRYLLFKMMNNEMRDIPFKDEYGKPYFKDNSTNLSISHSGNLAAVLISHYICGLDIQEMNPKIAKILPRILSVQEASKFLKNINNSLSAFAWSTKEAVYKAYGKKLLDVRKAIRITSYELNGSNYSADVQIEKDDMKIKYQTKGFVIKNYVVVTAFKL